MAHGLTTAGGAVRISGVTEYWIETAASFRLDVSGPDHLAPLLGFLGDELGEVGGREREHLATEIGKPRLDFRIGEAGVDLRIELVNNVGGRVLGRADAEPLARLIARHEFSHNWDARQRLRACRGRYRERAQPASPDILDRCDSAGEHDLHLPAEQIGQRGPAAAIRHMDHVDPGHHLEQLARYMWAASDANRRHVDFAWIRLG